MAISTVPFVLQNASHPAALFRQALSSFLPQYGGVINTGDLNVHQTGTPSMAVVVDPGRIWVKGSEVSNVIGGIYSSQGLYYAENDATVTLSIANADPSNPRLDNVYVSVNDQAYSGTLNQANLAVATGTPNASPVGPAVPNNAYVLAQVYVAANASSISNANITSFTSTINAPNQQTVTPNGLYTSRNSNYGTPYVYHANGRAWLSGALTNVGTTTWTAGTVYALATLPSGYAPQNNIDTPMLFRTGGTSYSAYMTVTTAGAMTFALAGTLSNIAGGGATMSLENISWILP